MKRRAAMVAIGFFCLPVSAQSWLYEARPEVGLSVSDKFANAPQAVEYTVTQPNGTESKVVIQPVAGGERAGTAHYPSDFPNAGMHDGHYKWTASVDGKIVLSGSFSYVPTKNGLQVLVPR